MDKSKLETIKDEFANKIESFKEELEALSGIKNEKPTKDKELAKLEKDYVEKYGKT